MKTLFIATLAIVLAGCATTYSVSTPIRAYHPEECKGKNAKDLVIKYGDSKIDVTNKVKVKKSDKELLVIVLDPDKKSEENVNYEELVIHITGKDNKSSWINWSIAYKQTDNGKYRVCIDDIKAEKYQYQVFVPDVGTIDPRIQIEN